MVFDDYRVSLNFCCVGVRVVVEVQVGHIELRLVEVEVN